MVHLVIKVRKDDSVGEQHEYSTLPTRDAAPGTPAGKEAVGALILHKGFGAQCGYNCTQLVHLL